ncbi:MAG: DNA-binding LytR/AlgR family response regulator, partial [Psychroserpens sp.]
VVDYLLKPFSFERFLSAVNKVSASTPKLKQVRVENEQALTNQLFLKQNNSHIQVDVNTILYIEASGNYTKVVTTLDTITIREKISTTLEILPKEKFLQVHKSFAIATKHIKRIDGNRIYIEDYTIPIGKLYKANLIKILN